MTTPPRGPVDWARQQAAERETQPATGDLRQQITAAIRDTPARYPDDIAAAVWRVVEPAIAELAQAIRLTREYVGEELLPPVEGWSWYDALSRWAPHELPPAHNAGPSIRECADQDAAHWTAKYAGEGQ